MLISMLKTSHVFNASICGDNCSKWILKIAEKKDLEIDLEHVMLFDDSEPASIKMYLINKNIMLNSYLEYLSNMCELEEDHIIEERKSLGDVENEG